MKIGREASRKGTTVSRLSQFGVARRSVTLLLASAMFPGGRPVAYPLVDSTKLGVGSTFARSAGPSGEQPIAIR